MSGSSPSGNSASGSGPGNAGSIGSGNSVPINSAQKSQSGDQHVYATTGGQNITVEAPGLHMGVIGAVAVAVAITGGVIYWFFIRK